MAYKSKGACQLLLNAFKAPESLQQLELHEWELLIRCARRSKLVAALGKKIELN